MEDGVCLLASWWFGPPMPPRLWPTAAELAGLAVAQAHGWNKHQIAAALRHAERAGYTEAEAVAGFQYRHVWRITPDGLVLARLLFARERCRITGRLKTARTATP